MHAISLWGLLRQGWRIKSDKEQNILDFCKKSGRVESINKDPIFIGG